jgi:hypothetical protein
MDVGGTSGSTNPVRRGERDSTPFTPALQPTSTAFSNRLNLLKIFQARGSLEADFNCCGAIFITHFHIVESFVE